MNGNQPVQRVNAKLSKKNQVRYSSGFRSIIITSIFPSLSSYAET